MVCTVFKIRDAPSKRQQLDGEVHLLEDLPISSEFINTITSHHENIDGSGYPKGISGADTPFFSKMIDRRPYRKDTWSINHTLIELNNVKGTLYESSDLNSLCEMIKDN